MTIFHVLKYSSLDIKSDDIEAVPIGVRESLRKRIEDYVVDLAKFISRLNECDNAGIIVGIIEGYRKGKIPEIDIHNLAIDKTFPRDVAYHAARAITAKNIQSVMGNVRKCEFSVRIRKQLGPEVDFRVWYQEELLKYNGEEL